MEKRTTLKDIANHAGVSVFTVHKAIYGKPGISEETKEKILKIAKTLNYSVNIAASSLKRDVLNIAVVMPLLRKELNYFFYQLWDGIDDAKLELQNLNASITCFHCDETWQSEVKILNGILQRNDINGVVVYCWDDTKLNDCFKKLLEKGIPVVTVNSDATNSCRIGCVTAKNICTGELAAELMSLTTARKGRIILLAGNRMMKNVRDIAFGFFEYIQKNCPDLSITELNDFGGIEKLKYEFACVLDAFDDVVGVYSNSARNVIPMCDVLKEKNVAGKIMAIGTDVFEDLIPYLKEGTIQATIWQDQRSQAREAVLMLFHYLVGQKTEQECITMRNGIIMKSNYQDYL